MGFLKEIIFTIFPQKNITLTNDRSGLTRSAMFLFVFIIIHAVGNLHVFLGPEDFNGYGYFYVRLYWTGFGLDANIVEEYVLLCALLHVSVALKRTIDMSLSMPVSSGKLNLAISGVCLLSFMMIHLYQYRFGDAKPFTLCPPPYLINLMAVFSLNPFAGKEHPFLNLFWVTDNPCSWEKSVRDIYGLEFDVFASPGWVMFYISSVMIFCTHMCLGWQKVIPAPSLDIPKRYHTKAIHWGYIMTAFIAAIYISFPLYAHLFAKKEAYLPQPQLP
jgi:succinate dehydrogenase hydrophobic anchor subunit